MPATLRQLLCICSLCFAFEGYAQTDPPPSRDDAEQEYKEAETNYKLQKYQEALEGFERSYALSNEPSILFNIAQCYRLLGQLDEARKAYLSFLRDAPDNPMRANAKARLKEIEDAQTLLATKGSIQISSQQDPAQVFLNGELKGLSPLTLQDLEPGEHTITIKKQGYADYQINATVNPAQPLELNIPRLVPLSGPSSETAKLLFWGGAGFGGLGVASGSVSGVFLFLANQEQRDTTVIDLNEDGAIDQTELQAKGKLIRDRVDTATTFGIISGVLISTAITSTVTGLIIHKRAKENKP